MNERNQAEWLLLQRSFDQMEQQALWLKVVAVVLWLWLVQTESSLTLLLGLIAVFWLHEAIWKTQQSRTGQRLLQLEVAIRDQQDCGCQWQTAWLAERGGIIELVIDYLRHCLKPTVAVTYLVLLAATLVRHFN